MWTSKITFRRLLMSKVSEMTGTPWHTEYLKKAENDERRDKRKCCYYRDDHYCAHLCAKCISSTGCIYYEEVDEGKYVTKKKHRREERKERTKTGHFKTAEDEGLALFPIGSIVKHKQYGEGKVVRIENGEITVSFDDKNRTYTLSDVYRNKLFERAKVEKKYRITGKYEGEYVISCYEDKLGSDIFQNVIKGLSLRFRDLSNRKWICIHIFVDTSNNSIYMKKDRYIKYKREIRQTQTLKIAER